mmetsp:Transcript_68953/g.121925  ORF Transcript_68953/g.121925 Transcript_68953/m.121925 type:complete len:667 (+) Transcript_68953:101-2101(+)|eukprot:CAMPEP_0197662324 /NCGR_PEP_ID=MMETSP1338-20131121/52929_1 /TAXON_ID=43686 ORGANISM="Pelagodinium beii, Strain RCC1491" /NCGR_SAMPLE_ID=MMETSP1338 /ASSEMBLY_ACC=CAM_ASM_000754 /LENGTH=666 /DNA_ID=CAMNT_0043240121 /DNA_START=90 /DNA_END=2090 /DNA_ORIENTATION=+
MTHNSRAGASPDIRFSDVAHYVGLSLMKDPASKSNVSKSSVRLNPLKSQEMAHAQRSQASMESTPSRQDQAKVEKLKAQLEFLRAEQKAEMEQLRRTESSLSDSMILEKKAQRRAAKHRELRDFHQRHASELDKKMSSLQKEISASRVTKNALAPASSPPRSASGHLPAVTQSDSSRRGTPGSPDKAKPTQMEDAMRKTAPAQMKAPEEEPDVAADDGMTLKEYFDAADLKKQPDTLQSSASQQVSVQEKKSTMSTKRSMNMSSIGFHRPPPLSDEEISANHDLYREIIRRDLIDSAGSAKDAFKKMDLNGSGNISCQDFGDGVRRLGIDWQAITHMNRPRELFKLFDLDKDGVIVFQELFPDAVDKEPERVSTPEFWNRWVKRNRDLEMGLRDGMRDPAWQPKGPDAELELLFSTSAGHEQAGEQRKWMAATIRRLKNRGKSDARCREIVAGHLPRGTGPKDREDVQTFSAQEVKVCRKTYNDQVNDPVRNIQKVVYDMREQRRVLHDFRQKLWTVTMEPVMRKQMEDDRKTAASAVGLGGALGLGGGGGPGIGAAASNPKEAVDTGPVKRSLKSIAQECNMEDAIVEDLCRDFLNYADKSEALGKKGFLKFLQQLAPNRTISDSDADHWWEQVMKAMPMGDERGRGMCDFERFAIWYSTSEARA